MFSYAIHSQSIHFEKIYRKIHKGIYVQQKIIKKQPPAYFYYEKVEKSYNIIDFDLYTIKIKLSIDSNIIFQFNFLSKMNNDDYEEKGNVVQKSLQKIHNKIEKYIHTHDIKLFSDEVTTKRDISRIQREKIFIRSTRTPVNSILYQQPPISKTKRPFSVCWEEEQNNKIKSKEFIHKVRRQKQQLYGKSQQYKNQLKFMEKQNNLKQQQLAERKLQQEKEKRRAKAALTIQLNRLRKQQRGKESPKNNKYRYHSLNNINQEEEFSLKIMQNQQFAKSVAGSQLIDLKNSSSIPIKLPKISNSINRSKTQAS